MQHFPTPAKNTSSTACNDSCLRGDKGFQGIELLVPIHSYVQSNAMMSIPAKDRRDKMDDLHACHRAPLSSFNLNGREYATQSVVKSLKPFAMNP